MANKSINGQVAKGYAPSVSARDTIEEMQSTRCYAGSLYQNKFDLLWYYCIKDVGSNAAAPTAEFFDMNPVSLKSEYDINKAQDLKIKKLEDTKFSQCVALPNGLPTAESILQLESGLYNIIDKEIYGIGKGYYTVHRLNDHTDTGDSTIVVYRAGSGDSFWVTSFNSNAWTGWKEFNHCPYKLGDIMMTTNNQLPSVTWPGTTWSKIEGRYLKGTSGNEASKVTGGSMTKTIGVEHMPSHGHGASGSADTQGWHAHNANHGHSAWQDAHLHGQPAHSHGVGYASVSFLAGGSQVPLTTQAYAGTTQTGAAGSENTGGAQPTVYVNATNFDTAGNGSHNHNISVSVGVTGGNQPLSIEPAYYTVHYWLRTA